MSHLYRTFPSPQRSSLNCGKIEKLGIPLFIPVPSQLQGLGYTQGPPALPHQPQECVQVIQRGGKSLYQGAAQSQLACPREVQVADGGHCYDVVWVVDVHRLRPRCHQVLQFISLLWEHKKSYTAKCLPFHRINSLVPDAPCWVGVIPGLGMQG